VLTAVAVSLILAALILTIGSDLLAVGIALAMVAFTALDIRELIHRLGESHTGIAGRYPSPVTVREPELAQTVVLEAD